MIIVIVIIGIFVVAIGAIIQRDSSDASELKRGAVRGSVAMLHQWELDEIVQQQIYQQQEVERQQQMQYDLQRLDDQQQIQEQVCREERQRLRDADQGVYDFDRQQHFFQQQQFDEQFDSFNNFNTL